MTMNAENKEPKTSRQPTIKTVPSPEVPSPAPKGQRLLSLDVFRGFTLMGMVLVNSPGSTKYIYPAIGHVAWNGWGFADAIFPFFLFIVGVAIPYSIESRKARTASRASLWLHIVRRSVLLFAIGLFMNWFPSFDMHTIRVFGVLQRIALCYFFASIIYLEFNALGEAVIGAALLLFYFVMMKYVPVPGYGAGVLESVGNWAQYIDVRVIPGTLMNGTSEGKGLLSTLPAIASTLMGVLTGRYLKSTAAPLEKAVNLYLFGSVSFFLGGVWSLSFPINQNLWTSSLVLYMGGMALVVFASCYYLVDIRKSTWWTPPFLVFGTNSIAVWVVTVMFLQTLELIKFTGSDGKLINAKTCLFNAIAACIGPMLGSLLFAVLYVLFWLAVMSVLYRRKIFIKI